MATAGGAIYPYREYYRKPWEGATSLERLQSVRARGRRVWVLYTIPEYIEASDPELMRTLRTECAVEGVFRGTVGGGDITACVLPPVSAAGSVPGTPQR